MDFVLRKKMRMSSENVHGEDRISSLSDDLIHEILSNVDTRIAVQTSVLSKRWKPVWKTLPFLKLDGYGEFFNRREARFSKFVHNVFTNRNYESQILKLELNVKKGIGLDSVQNYINYAVSRNVYDLHVDFCHNYSFSIFSSSWLKELKLTMRPGSDRLMADCWNLPVLTTLHLISPNYGYSIPMSLFTCLPALETLCLEHFVLPESFRLPSLRVLRLARCYMPEIVWHLPALISLEMDNVVFSTNMNEFFSVLVKLQCLILSFRRKNMLECFISCPQLVNLELRTRSMGTTSTLTGNIVVMAPNLCNFSSVGIFPVLCGVSKLENVNIKLRDCFKDKSKVPWEKLKQYYHRFIFMFPGLGSAKILTLDLDTTEALAAVSDFLAHFPSPFYNLKYVKLPKGYKESSLSSSMKGYLLGGSPKARIVTSLTQCDVIPQMGLASPTAQNAVLEEHVARAGNDQASSSWETSGFRLWMGHDVKSEFVSLLERITNKYPDTLKHFTTKVDIFHTIKLNVFCITVTSYMNTPVTDVDGDMITEYKTLFSDLQRWGFNISWLVRRLNYVEQLRYSKPLLNELFAIISSVHDLQTLGADKMTEIRKAFVNMDAGLSLHYIGDDLLPSP